MRLLILLAMMLAMNITAHAEAPKIIMNGEYVMQADAIDITDPPPINNISKALDVLDDALDANGRKLEFIHECVLTYYCPGKCCNGKWGAIDSKGNPLEWGTVAVDPHYIPLGTQMVIDGYDTVFTARDTGSGVDGYHIDVFVPVSHSEALRMGQGERRKVWKVE